MDRLLEVVVDYHIHDLHINNKSGLLWSLYFLIE